MTGPDRGARIPGAGMADPAEPASAGLDVSAKNVVDLGTTKVCEPHDAGDEPFGVGRDHEVGLTDGTQRLRAFGAIARHALHEHRRHDVVPAVCVGPEL